ncbi:MAG: twin-arginine translocase TatA/TatE family subunit [Chloroflexi bacterium]|nr:twin-arginine translocase TatA/TatE family subunit [Chloroflexota bacterium]
MSFLGMGTFEIIIILLVAFIFLGPERMVDAARTLGKWTGELRRMGSTVQAEMDDIGNIGAPLSRRPTPPRKQQSHDGDSPSNTPLNQDEPDARQADGPVAYRRNKTDTAQQQQAQPPQPPREETMTTSGEDSA